MVFISRQNLGWSGNCEIPDHLGFFRHMKTRLFYASRIGNPSTSTCAEHMRNNNREFKKRRRVRQRQRQKAVILLVKRTKMTVLHVRHAFLNNSLPYSSKLLREMTNFKVLTTTWTNYSESFESHSLLQIRPYQSSYRTLRSY